MSDVIISVENLGKRYILNHQGVGEGGYQRFSERLEHWAKTPWRLFQQSMESRTKGTIHGKLDRAGGDLGIHGKPNGGAGGKGGGELAIHGMAPGHPPLAHSGDASGRERSSLTRKELLNSGAGGKGGGELAIHGKLEGAADGGREEFWALKGVSFEVKRGEVVGIIGRNGAGKSTLLKILSRITEPTEGRVTLKGRVASLLEVGTGFHPELTGRENIFLNGAILGMSQAEIRKKFDEIVAFAEVERFLDTPVKRYSSGMYVRLAFAVAAHLEPEILVVDEVLAVGDAEFQKKCLGKMKDVATGGRTVLFVSHQLPSVKSLCSRVLWLDAGKIRENGKTTSIISNYLASSSEIRLPEKLLETAIRQGNGKIRFTSLQCENAQGKTGFNVQTGSYLKIVTKVKNLSGEKHPACSYSLDFYDDFGYRVLLFRSDMYQCKIDIDEKPLTISTIIEKVPLCPGRYRISVYLGKDGESFYEYIENAANLEVTEGDFFGTGHQGHANLCKVLCPFKISYSNQI